MAYDRRHLTTVQRSKTLTMAEDKPDDVRTARPADDAAVADAQENAEFGAGFDSVEGKPADKLAEKPADKPTGKPDRPDPAATPRAEATPAPEYVQITAKDWAEIKAAAAKTASYDQQLSRAFGTIGNLQKLVNEQRAAGQHAAAAATARKIEIPKDAFERMSRDFPELAEQTREAMERALSAVPGPGGSAAEPDRATIETMMATYGAKRELEVLEDQFPDWRDLVGAVDVSSGMQPDPDNPFRKWLSGKDIAYQQRVNSSESAAVIGRAIRTWQKETAAAPKVNGTPRDAARADRIRAAVQPRGDNAGADAGKTDQDEFEAGFNSR